VNVHQVKERIAAGARDADVAIGLLVMVADTIEDALGGAKHTTHDSRHPKVVSGLAKLGQAKDDVGKASAVLGTSVDAAQSYAGTL
jgi:alkanesulfonate monooxygenase SsuD/methylene tetrahydromethanopterin reductase-like flavin-dependent oxidoreductase (luciferase family)